MQKVTILKTAAALTTAAVIAVGAMSATAAPVGSRAAQLEKATAGQVIDVRHRGRWIGPAIAGAIIGGAIVAGSQPRHYDDDYYEDGPPPGAYAVPPRGPGPRMCWVETGPNGATGYWAAC